METIISSLISAGITLVVCILNNRSQNTKTREENGKTQALIEYQLSELTKKVEKHNNLIERTYKLEEQTSRAFDELKRVNHRLKQLEEDDGK